MPRPATYTYRVAATRDLYLPVSARPATYSYRGLDVGPVDKWRAATYTYRNPRAIPTEILLDPRPIPTELLGGLWASACRLLAAFVSRMKSDDGWTIKTASISFLRGPVIGRSHAGLPKTHEKTDRRKSSWTGAADVASRSRVR